MVSYLAEEVRSYRQDEARGLRPTLPARAYRPSSAHILKFCRRSDGGKAYDDLEAALDRLTKTTIKVVNLSGGKRRQVDSRPLIGGYQVVSSHRHQQDRSGRDHHSRLGLSVRRARRQSPAAADAERGLLPDQLRPWALHLPAGAQSRWQKRSTLLRAGVAQALGLEPGAALLPAGSPRLRGAHRRLPHAGL